VELANDRFAERLTLAEVASNAGVHPVHLARQFRSRLGCTYGEFVRRIRLTRALERLRNGSQPIAQVAAEAGFADQSHLTRLMTAVVGIAPAAYRRHCRG
jgi:AraC family transcriptional regulator